ncbi:MAG: diguanylate cyclase [Polyangiaceae bacterium]|nr:diguanylate cyclase [Polyangiaceae bacterium]
MSLFFGACLFWSIRGETAVVWDLLMLGSLVLSLAIRAVRRLRVLSPTGASRLDAEICTHLVVLVLAGILYSPGGLDGQYYPALYALVIVVAGFARPLAAAATVVYAIGLEASIAHSGLGREVESLIPHAALVVVFSSLNLLAFRAEITRVRRLSRTRLQGEIDRMKEAARSYRLIGAPSSAIDAVAGGPASHAGGGDEERLLRSSVEEIHLTLEHTLDLLRRSLGLRSAVLMWLDSAGRHLHIREISTESKQIDPGPFSAAEGIFAAALSNRRAVSMSGDKAGRHVPYYGSPREVSYVRALPLLEHNAPRGLLVADRKEAEPLTDDEMALFESVSRYIMRTIENERIFVQLERSKVEQGKLYRAVNLLADATSEVEVIEAGVSSAREFTAFDFAVVTLFDRSQSRHEICAASGEGTEELIGRTFRHNSGLVAMAVANQHPLPYRGHYDSARQTVFSKGLRPPPLPGLLVIPMVVQNNVLGTLVLGSEQRDAFGESVRPILEVLASHIAVSLSNARMVKRLENLATTDGMTGLLNKRSLTDLAEAKIRAAVRFGRPLSVLVCDIDHFKKVNDTYGHDVGDVVIKGFADVLKRTKRDTDLVARFGGEEFVFVCEETESDGAVLLAERIRTELEATTFHSAGGAIKVTCSVGCATFPLAGSDWASMFKATDEALYVSKRTGRNRVSCWSPSVRGAA